MTATTIRPPVPRYLAAAALGLLAFGLVLATVVYARDHGRIASIWPLNAVVIVILLRRPARDWLPGLVAVWLATVGANLAIGDGPLRATLLASANLVEITIAASLLVRPYRVRLTRRSGFARFLRAITLACLASTLVAAAALILTGGNPPVEGAGLWLAAHWLSLLVFAPSLSIALAGRVSPLFSAPRRLRTVAILLVVMGITLLTFVQSAFPLLFVTPVLLVLVAFQLGLAGAALMALLVAIVSIPLTLNGHGPLMLVEGSMAVRMLVLQAFLTLISMTAIIVGGAVAERRSLAERLTHARRRAQHKALREGELLDQARLAETISNVGYWTLDPVTGAVFWSPEVYRIHGVDPATFDPGLEDALAFYLPADRVMIEALIGDRLRTGDDWSFDARLLRRSDGDVRNVRSVAVCQKDGWGQVAKIFGVFKDLTEERRMMAALSDSETRYRLLANNATDVIATYDMDGVFSYLSPSIKDMLGYKPDDLVGQPTSTIMTAQEAARVTALFAAALPRLDNFAVEYQASHRDGTPRWLEARPRPQFDTEGQLIGFVDNVRDVTDRRDREAALAEARAVAEAATQAKAAFLANMSHEIRTPINGVIGFAGLLAETSLDAAQARYVDRIRAAGTGLSTLIDDILDVSRIEAGKVAISNRDFDLKSLVHEVVDLVAAGVRHKPITFSVEADPGLNLHIEADDSRVRQILLNVIGNAAKFTQAGSVNVEITRDGAQLTVCVRDTGPGIPADQQAGLFESFTQADASISRQFGGSGLGLTISRSLARLMNGDLGLESEAGLGTTARLTLPYTIASRLRPSDDHSTGAAGDPSTVQPLAILVVDDIEMNREFVQIALERQGHTVTAIGSGQEAIDALASGQRFDLVLMDVQMPYMDGLTATRALRAQGGRGGSVPIIGLSAAALPEQIAACFDAGMDDHIAKPIDPVRLVKRVHAIAQQGGRSQAPDVADKPDQALRDLATRYAEHLRTLPAELDRLRDGPAGEQLAALAVMAHSVGGTAGSLGFAKVSATAFAVEDSVSDLSSGREPAVCLEEAIDAFRQALEECRS